MRATSRRSRLSAAAAGAASFSIPAGHAKRIALTPDTELRAKLRRRGRAVARVTATLGGDRAGEKVTRLITVQRSG
jgi:hypothetical protein